MKRLCFASLALIGTILLIFQQCERLDELRSQLTKLHALISLQMLSQLPPSSVQHTVEVAGPSRTKHLGELIQKSHKDLGGIPMLHLEELFDDYPELETAFLNAKKAQLRIDFGAFFVLAGFSEDQIERYLEISLAGERDWIALAKEAAARGIKLTDPSISLRAKELAAQNKSEMDNFLGPNGTALRDKYRKEKVSRRVMLEIAKATAVNSHPVSFDQINSFASATTEIGVFDDEKASRDANVFNEALKKAGEILSPDQQKCFELIIDARQASIIRELDRRRSQ